VHDVFVRVIRATGRCDSTEALPSFEQRYAEYQKAGGLGRERSLAALLQEIEDACKDTPGQAPPR
jgi:hypothetical protein